MFDGERHPRIQTAPKASNSSARGDGTITARDLETGLARGGGTRAEALAQLAEVLELHEGGGESIDDPDAFLREELGIDPDEADEEVLPDFPR